MLRPELCLDESTKLRFMREAQTAVSLRHENVIETLLPFEVDEQLFIPMEFLTGRSLLELSRGRKRPWSIEELVDYIAQAATGLGYAHSQGILHRDVTLSNLFVLDDDRSVKVLDFGLAKGVAASRLTSDGTLMGTPFYLAPEVLVGKAATKLSDIFSLGIVLFRLITGRPPYRLGSAKTAIEILRGIHKAQQEGLPRPSQLRPEIPAELDALTDAMLSVEPAGRPHDAREVASRLASLSDEPLGLEFLWGNGETPGDEVWPARSAAPPPDDDDELSIEMTVEHVFS